MVHKVTTGLRAETVKEAPGKRGGVCLLCEDQLWSSLYLWTSKFSFPIVHHVTQSLNYLSYITSVKEIWFWKQVNFTYTSIRHRTKTEKVNVIFETYLRHWVWGLPSSSVWRRADWRMLTDTSQEPTVSTQSVNKVIIHTIYSTETFLPLPQILQTLSGAQTTSHSIVTRVPSRG